MAKNENKIAKVANVWTRFSNPLRSLNNIQIEQMLNNARYGDDVKLQLCYSEIEKNTPVFLACINKRIAGIMSRAWDILPVDESSEAKAQADKVKEMFLKSDNQVEDNLTNAMRHLALVSFRGRSAVKPFVTDGKLSFKSLQNWNFLRYNGKNYWNPDSQPAVIFNGNLPSGVVELPQEEICYAYDENALDWIGMTIYLRQLIAEEQWARVIEKMGIPQVLLKMPDGTPQTEAEQWNYRAQAIFEGASGVLPYGTEVENPTVAARQQDPFSQYVAHQMEQFCILAVGGTLDVLAGTSNSAGTGMGSDVAQKQADQFANLVTYDCKRISNALQVAVKKCVGNEDVKCYFSFVEDDDTTPEEYINMAVQLKNIGITIDAQKLRELTKLQIISDSEKDVWTPTSEEK